MTWAVHVTLAPRWFDPAETESAITPFMVLYPLHDAMVKLMPGGMQPSLAVPDAEGLSRPRRRPAPGSHAGPGGGARRARRPRPRWTP
jgi:hypothetical protein